MDRIAMQLSKAELAFIADSIKAASKLYEPEGVDVEDLRDRIRVAADRLTPEIIGTRTGRMSSKGPGGCTCTQCPTTTDGPDPHTRCRHCCPYRESDPVYPKDDF